MFYSSLEKVERPESASVVEFPQSASAVAEPDTENQLEGNNFVNAIKNNEKVDGKKSMIDTMKSAKNFMEFRKNLLANILDLSDCLKALCNVAGSYS